MKYSLAIVFAAVLWGVDGLLRQSLYYPNTLSAFTIIAVEHMIGFLILSIYVFVAKKAKLADLRANKNFFLNVLFIAFFSGFLGTIAFTKALSYTNFIPVSIVFLVQKLQPIFTITASYLILKEKPDKKFWGYAVVALIAGYFMTFPMGKFTTASNVSLVIPAVLALVAAFGWGTSTVFSKNILHSKTQEISAFYRFGFTLLIVALVYPIYTSITGDAAIINMPNLGQIGTLAIIAVTTGMVALVIYYYGLRHVQAYRSCILELAFPATGLFVDIFVNKVTFDLSQIVAATILVICIYQIAKLNPSK